MTNSQIEQEKNENDTELEKEFFGENEIKTEEVNVVMQSENIMAASTPPMSPGKRILRVVGSPGRFVKT